MTANQTKKLIMRILRARSVKRWGVPYVPHNEDETIDDFILMGFDYVRYPLHIDRADPGADRSVSMIGHKGNQKLSTPMFCPILASIASP